MDAQINLDGSVFHKQCAKCEDCKCQITLSNFAKHEFDNHSVLLLCKTHLLKRFHEQGSYVGAEKYKVKAERDVHAAEKAGRGDEQPKTAAVDEQKAQLSEDEQKGSGLVKKNLESRKSFTAASAAAAATGQSPPKPSAILADHEKPTVPVREISRRMSTSRENMDGTPGSPSAPKTLQELVPEMSGVPEEAAAAPAEAPPAVPEAPEPVAEVAAEVAAEPVAVAEEAAVEEAAAP